MKSFPMKTSSKKRQAGQAAVEFALIIVFLMVFPWMMNIMISYTHTLLGSFQPYLR